ncbi:MAG: methyltransferase domain-containing protein [Acidimicrobiia bacterium]|nr:methyltransferase domain-containing protein [Acidimicrobiia bacterium]
MSQLVFGDDVARRIESLYLTRDAARRRRLVREALGTQPGDRVLDVGCGPGFYCLELAEEVGSEGQVVGIDAAASMLELARRRCQEYPNVSFKPGDALSLPVEDQAFDRALSVQVLEYVEPATAALTEMYRTLRPGGRVVIWDIDWETVSWHSSDPMLTKQVLEAWDRHLAHPSLPRSLAPRLRESGFEEVIAAGHIFTTISTLDPETYGGAIIPIIASYITTNKLMDDDKVAAWVDDQHRLSDNGEFYFACTQVCFTAEKPE